MRACLLFDISVNSGTAKEAAPSSGTTMFPTVAPVMGLSRVQSVEAASASDAINAPTDMDNAAHIESMSIRRMETLPVLLPA